MPFERLRLVTQMRLKALKLVFDGDSDEDAAFELPLSAGVVGAWGLQLQRLARSQDPALDFEQLRERADMSLLACLDWDLQPPSSRQVRFATAIAKELNLTLTADVMRCRGAMSDFIDRFAEEFKVQRAQRRALDYR